MCLRQRDDVVARAVGADLAAKERNTTKKQARFAEKNITAVLTLAAIVNVERIIRLGNEMHTLSPVYLCEKMTFRVFPVRRQDFETAGASLLAKKIAVWRGVCYISARIS